MGDDIHRADDGVRAPPGQEYVVITCTTENHEVPGLACAICVRGTFRSLEAAQAHAKRIQAAKCRFNTYIGFANAWISVPPDETHIDQKYEDPRLDSIMEMESQARKRGEESFNARLKKARAEGREYTTEDWVQERLPATESDL